MGRAGRILAAYRLPHARSTPQQIQPTIQKATDRSYTWVPTRPLTPLTDLQLASLEHARWNECVQLTTRQPTVAPLSPQCAHLKGPGEGGRAVA